MAGQDALPFNVVKLEVRWCKACGAMVPSTEKERHAKYHERHGEERPEWGIGWVVTAITTKAQEP